MMLTMTKIGDRLRRLRRERMLTQLQLAERAGVAHTTISRIESGAIEYPRFDTIRDLAAALGVDPAELVRGGE